MGSFDQTDVPFTVTHDRDVQFLVDKADVDETNATASMQNISRTFEQTQVVPETDALFFSRVAQVAQKAEGYHSQTAISAYTKAKVFDFNLRSCEGSDIDIHNTILTILEFQSAPPQGERRYGSNALFPYLYISIRAPARGATSLDREKKMLFWQFQFALPRGERQNRYKLGYQIREFQSALPQGERL